ncbi:F-box only protein 47-like [Nelusetta ayraudi]|uniref:F-box only protein 47-like n=1 Tax=Nelusetta ayraudi TaxID=303726 RepID=UPI003F7064DD
MRKKSTTILRKRTPSGQLKGSPRRTQPPRRTVVTRSQGGLRGGMLSRLPREVFDMILDRMTVVEMGIFCMASKEINRYIMDYVSSQPWKNTMIIRNFHNSTTQENTSTIQHYRELSMLFKRCTLLLPTKERLRFVLNKFAEIPCFSVDQCLAPGCIGFSSYGSFLQNLISGWDELECHRVFNYLCDMTNLPKKVQLVTAGKPGARWHEELQVRLFCREVLLDTWSGQLDRQLWLTMFLTPWPIVSQARLLFILYGPLHPGGTLGWQDLVDRELPQYALVDLARAIYLLFGQLEFKDGTKNLLLAILEELIVVPQPWHVENIARLLVLCGNSVCYGILASKAINRRLQETTKIIVYIILVCEKDSFHMSWAVKLVEQICMVFSTDTEKHFFIQQLENTFSQVTREVFEHCAAGNDLSRETFLSLRILLDSSAHFHTKFLQMLLK